MQHVLSICECAIFSWDLSACDLFVLNGNFQLVAKRESFIQQSPFSEAIQSRYIP